MIFYHQLVIPEDPTCMLESFFNFAFSQALIQVGYKYFPRGTYCVQQQQQNPAVASSLESLL
jgi:hypothetical protein